MELEKLFNSINIQLKEEKSKYRTFERFVNIQL